MAFTADSGTKPSKFFDIQKKTIKNVPRPYRGLDEDDTPLIQGVTHTFVS